MTDVDPEVRARDAIARAVAFHSDLKEIHSPVERARAVRLGYGWWLRCIRTARGVVAMHDAGVGHEAAPLLRVLQEHAAALALLSQEPQDVHDAVRFLWERRKSRLLGTARSEGFAVPAGATAKPPTGPAPPMTAVFDSTKDFFRASGQSARYVTFMIDSAYVHPSADGADAYFDEARGALVEPALDAVSLRVTATAVGTATLAIARLSEAEVIHRLALDVSEILGVDLDFPLRATITPRPFVVSRFYGIRVSVESAAEVRAHYAKTSARLTASGELVDSDLPPTAEALVQRWMAERAEDFAALFAAGDSVPSEIEPLL